jgi:hypothetical protein
MVRLVLMKGCGLWGCQALDEIFCDFYIGEIIGLA